ncbi:MAG: hypothetical protein ACTSRA_15280, partial [Promethearchaeota archaeon]
NKFINQVQILPKEKKCGLDQNVKDFTKIGSLADIFSIEFRYVNILIIFMFSIILDIFFWNEKLHILDKYKKNSRS